MVRRKSTRRARSRPRYRTRRYTRSYNRMPYRKIGRNKMLRQKWKRKGAAKMDKFLSGHPLFIAYTETAIENGVRNPNILYEYSTLKSAPEEVKETGEAFLEATNTKIDQVAIANSKIHAVLVKGENDLIRTYQNMFAEEQKEMPLVKGIKLTVMGETQNSPCFISFRKKPEQQYVFKMKLGKCSVFMRRYKDMKSVGQILNRVVIGAYGQAQIRVRFYVKYKRAQGSSAVPRLGNPAEPIDIQMQDERIRVQRS